MTCTLVRLNLNTTWFAFQNDGLHLKKRSIPQNISSNQISYEMMHIAYSTELIEKPFNNCVISRRQFISSVDH